MDEHNAHHFWGISPAVDLNTLVPQPARPDQPVRILQVASYDSRHTLATISRSCRHSSWLGQDAGRQVHLFVWEEEPEGLARHLLLLAVLLDEQLLPRERVKLLLELHGNALLRERAATYLDAKARQLEAVLVSLASGGLAPAAQGGGEGLAALASILDLSHLKYQDKDALVETLQRWRSSAEYDMVKAWDARLRKWHGDRYDFRRNMVDWDYHMRLQPAGSPGQDPAHGSIVHFHHFRHWRAHGVAYELRDSAYNHPNRSLLSTAYGRTKEFKDRSGKDVGRSVSAWGWWGDVLNSPYHGFGMLAEDVALYRVTNKQYAHTAVDVAEHNIMSFLHELRHGAPLEPSGGASGREAHRAKVARGPTTMADLQQEAEKHQQQQQQQQQQGQQQEQCQLTCDPPQGQEEEAPAQQERRAADAVGATTGKCAEGSCGSASSTCSSMASSAAGQDEAGPAPAVHAAAVDAATTSHAREADGPQAGYGSHQQAASSSGDGGAATAPAAATGPPATYSSGGRAQAVKALTQQMQEKASVTASGSEQREALSDAEAAVRAEEARLDAQARSRCQPFRLVLVTGDIAKAITGRAKHAGAFSALSLGHRHMHLLGPDHGLAKVAAPGAKIVAENARHVLQLTREQAALFVDKMDELAAGGGWAKATPPLPQGLTEAHCLYVKPLP